MLWFSVWAVLVLGTLVGAFFLLRSLWRSARALLSELARASEVLAELAERSEELRRLREESAVPVSPTLFADRGPLRARVEELRAAREARRQVRWERDEVVRAGWRAVFR